MDDEWLLDELAYAGPDHLDSAYVAAYNRKAGYDPSDDVEILRLHGLDASSTLVDLGAGTGTLALAAAPHCRRVVAVDVSPAMFGQLRERASAPGLANVECLRAGFLTYEHTGAPADLVFTRNALHQLPDFWKALALERIARCMRAGGCLRIHDLIFDFSPAQTDDVIAAWLEGAVDDPAIGYTREEFAEHLRTEFSTFRWLFEPMLTAAGFEIVDVAYRRGIYGAYTCIKR